METVTGTARTMLRKGSSQMFLFWPSYFFRGEVGLISILVDGVTDEFGILIHFTIISEVFVFL